MRRREAPPIPLTVATLSLALALTAGCSVGVQSYDEFRSAVDSGATCSQLWDIQKNFEGTADEKRVVSDLKEIGCDTAGSVRDDTDED
jgi:hypothetical protein